MKKIIFLFAIVISFSCKAQLFPHPAGSYITNPLLDQFVGTWLWTSGTDTMKIVLQKQKIHYPAPLNYDEDNLVGWHSYVKGGVLVESSLQYIGDPFWNGHFTLHGGLTVSGTPVKPSIRFTTFNDLTKHKTSDNLYFSMSLNTATPLQATWKLRNSAGLKNKGYAYGFTVPMDMVFTKQ